MILKSTVYSVISFGLSEKGPIRAKNEDAFKSLPEYNFYVLADGMGGHPAGDIAAAETVSALSDIIKKGWLERPLRTLPETVEFIRQAIQEVNMLIYLRSQSRRDWKGMGTTLCSLQFHDEGLVIANVGDSRIYRARGGKLKLLTKDHTLMRETFDFETSDEESCLKNVLTKAIGPGSLVKPTMGSFAVMDGDIFLMCSDGLYGSIDPSHMASIIYEGDSVENSAKRLIKEALDHGGQDNITALLMQVKNHVPANLPR